jgi:hypothetical protein
MKETTNLFKNKLLLFRAKSARLEKMFPVSSIRRALPIHLQKVVSLSMGRVGSLSDRIRIAHNFFSRILKINRHHGSEFTVKWIKANQVVLQKYMGGDKVKSLRSIEPNLPLPRLINGFPAIINRRDRDLIRSGAKGVLRFWLSLFGSYRIMAIVGKTKLNTIYDPFKGKPEFVLDVLSLLKNSDSPVFYKRLETFSKIPRKLAPSTFVLSHKTSPSNSLSYQGLFTDYYLLTRGNAKQQKIFHNLMEYLELIGTKYPIRRMQSLLRSLESITSQMKYPDNYRLKRSALPGNSLSQFSIKEEAAGKIRVFALIDSITQSFLRPLHDYLFDILRVIPNDGTFNQDESVLRSIEKGKKYNCAYSFDLSAATDRLPRQLTSHIMENLVALPGFSSIWEAVMVDRDFSFPLNSGKKYPHLLTDHENIYRYSVGQPMGGLSSWAGLAITHHWILQYCSWSLGNLTGWEERYEVLGDDIVIFDHSLAQKYLEVMEKLGVDINLSKSIVSPNRQVFEFAKRTLVDGINVSSLSFQQIISQTSIGARVADAVSYIRSNLIDNIPLLGNILSRNGGSTAFSKLKAVGMESIALLGLLHQKGVIEHRVVVESLINPQYKEDFDWDKASFSLPLRSILMLTLSSLKGEKVDYPFSHPDMRHSVYEELEAELSSVILQHALYKIKLLDRDYDKILNKGAHSLFRGIEDKVFKASISGFFEDLIMNLSSDLDTGELLDDIEKILYKHAKYGHVKIEEALKHLESVESMIFTFTYKTDISRLRYETETSPVIDLIRKGVFGSRTRYWEIPNPTYS